MFALAALVVLVFGAAVLVPDVVGVQHDDGVYVGTAQELAGGNGYRIAHLQGMPAQTKYPILYTGWLAMWWAAWPRLLALQVGTLTIMAVGVSLAGAWALRWGYATRNAVLAGTLMAAVSPSLLYYATIPMSEGMYMICLMAALWAAEAEDRADRSPLRTVATGLLIALPFQCRSIGLVVPLFPALAWLAWRHPRRTGWLALGATAVIAPWFLWIASNPASGDVYNTSYAGYYGTYGVLSVRHLLTNTFMIGFSSGQLVVEGLSATLRQAVPFPALALTLFAVGLVPWIWLVRHRGRLLPLVMLSTAAVLLVWPWPPERFLVPLAPLLAIGFADAISGRVRERWAMGVLGLLIVLSAFTDVRVGNQVRANGYPIHPIQAEADIAGWRPHAALFGWIEQNTDPDAILASGMDPMVYLYTGRTGFRPWTGQPQIMFYGREGLALGTADDLERALRAGGATHFVEIPLAGFAEEPHLPELLSAHRQAFPDRWKRVYADPEDARFAVWVLGE